MRVLVTGNLGYVGTVLCPFLKKHNPNWQIIGYDSALYAHSLISCSHSPEAYLSHQFYGDVRDIKDEHLEGIDGVVHLAAISNDPMGKEFEQATSDINRTASVRLARLSAGCRVKNFVFAGSCSVYGETDGGPRKETDPVNPLTAYAKSKVGTEEDLSSANLQDMIFTSLRFATACGMSNRLRLDLVLNDFVAGAITSKEISILSDGTPWRPLIDVQDMSRAILWALKRPKSGGGQFLIVNAGKDEHNYQVKGLAETVAKLIPGTEVKINTKATPDKRSYKVDFSLFKSLAPDFMPRINLDDSISGLKSGLELARFDNVQFRNSSFIRLNSLRDLISSSVLDKNLRWNW